MNAALPTVSSASASFAQQRLWFLERFEPGSAVYNIPLAVRLRGPLDPAAVAGALRRIVLRHEALRTTFAVEDNEVVQVIHPELGPAWREVELTGEHVLAECLAEEARKPFDLSEGPLLSAVLWRLSAEDH